ncbi:RNA-binding protein [Rhizobiaceae bacterium BDR2-2]|uniref:RNA-binding protein n=1 Tax=Ectorhizobium quercum TaxID=2965071 RepID=A0AAE3ST54_9HYPH|nr:RNA-binding protein [Ectorhizobium quercum]MCX8995587.1 RNA-binding protein [Ectorhizobium quercum]
MSGPGPEAEAADDDMEALVNGRLCIVTRQSAPPEGLIRFVAGPDGSVVADLKRKLPGRGCWVTANRATIETALARKLFARALKADVTPAPDLVDRVERLLAADLASMMSMARKAGQFVMGATKVENAVRSGAALATFHARDAAPDGVRKIDQARKAFALMSDEDEIPSFLLLTREEMDVLMGQNAFIHAAALAGQAGEGVVKRATALVGFRDGGKDNRIGGRGGRSSR